MQLPAAQLLALQTGTHTVRFTLIYVWHEAPSLHIVTA